MEKWKQIRTRRDWPKAGKTVLVTREWPYHPNTISIAYVLLYRNKKYFVSTPLPKDSNSAYPYENVIAWMKLPEPFIV